MRTILIVDDSEQIREAVSFTLKKAGYDVLVAEDGKNALEYLDGRKIDLLLTDWHMPNLDGLELIKKVRKMEEYAKLTILFFTTESKRKRKNEAKGLGVAGWIIKPIEPEELLAALNKMLGTV